jgi:uncharacterized protein YbjT (DUF2867 family)
MKITVIGGRGRIGSRLVPKLREHGHEAVPACPTTGVDAFTGEALAEAIDGADVVVDVCDSPSFADDAVMEFFRTTTSNILAAGQNAGVVHHIALSVVGCDRIPDSGYMRAKVAQEELIAASPIPYTIVRATQFFEFVATIADAATEGDTVRLPQASIQPVAADEVAQAMDGTAVAAPVNGIVELAGPQPYRFEELFRQALHNDPRQVVVDADARYFCAALAEGSLLPGVGAQLGNTRFEDWHGQPALTA